MSEIKERKITAICDFLLECEEGHLFESSDPAPANCPICAEIKAAEKAARGEVLDLVKSAVLKERNSLKYDDQYGCDKAYAAIDKAYKERFHEQG